MNRLMAVVISQDQKNPSAQSPSDFEFDHLNFGGFQSDDPPVSPKLIFPEFRSSSPVPPSTNPIPPADQNTSKHLQSDPDNISPILLRDISLSSSHYPPTSSVKQLLAEEMRNKTTPIYDDFYIPVMKHESEDKSEGLSRIFMGLVPASMLQRFHGADESIAAGKRGKKTKENKWAFKGMLKKIVPSYRYADKEKVQSFQRQIRSAPLTPRSPSAKSDASCM